METEAAEPAQPPRRGARQTETPAGAEVAKVPDLPVSMLIDRASAYLGCSSWTAAGALANHQPDETLSADAAKAEIEKWLKTPLAEGK